MFTLGIRLLPRTCQCLFTAAVVLVLLPRVEAGSSMPKQDMYQMARCFELQEMAERPAWAGDRMEHLFSFLWLSDMHLVPGERTEITAKAIQYGCDTLHVDFGVITGDNNGHIQNPPKGTDADNVRVTGIQRHRELKTFLDNAFSVPYLLIPGDNWPWGFDAVFGATQFSLNISGMHLLFLSPDRSATGLEGCAVYSEKTWKWLAEDLQANRTSPTLLFTHETVLPPAFLAAGQLETTLAKEPQVLAVLSGHLHLDLDMNVGKTRQIVCPSVGLSAAHGMKEVTVFRDKIVICTHEYSPARKCFEPVRKWQKVDIPEHLRNALPVARNNPRMTGRNKIPAHPRECDQRLAKRSGELAQALLGFLLRIGMQGFLPGTDSNE